MTKIVQEKRAHAVSFRIKAIPDHQLQPHQILIHDKLVFEPLPHLPDYRIFDEVDTMITLAEDAKDNDYPNLRTRFFFDGEWRDAQQTRNLTSWIFTEIDAWYHQFLRECDHVFSIPQTDIDKLWKIQTSISKDKEFLLPQWFKLSTTSVPPPSMTTITPSTTSDGKSRNKIGQGSLILSPPPRPAQSSDTDDEYSTPMHIKEITHKEYLVVYPRKPPYELPIIEKIDNTKQAAREVITNEAWRSLD